VSTTPGAGWFHPVPGSQHGHGRLDQVRNPVRNLWARSDSDASPPVASVAAMRDEFWRPTALTAVGWGPRAWVAFGHRRLRYRPLEAGEQAHDRSGLGLSVVFNGASTNTPRAARNARSGGVSFFSTSDNECSQGVSPLGRAVVDHLVGMSHWRSWSGDTGRVVLARESLGIKQIYLADVPGALLFGRRCPRWSRVVYIGPRR